jgi:hypothetical protein
MKATPTKEADMPSGIYPVPQFHQYSDPSSLPTLGQRLKTWWQRDRLDEQLARGADHEASAELKLRASQLVSPTRRLVLSGTIERAVREARVGPAMNASLRRADVLECADELQTLAARLRDPRPIDARGAAMTRQLLADGGTSPLYRADTGRSLQSAVRSARLALDPIETGNASLASAA